MYAWFLQIRFWVSFIRAGKLAVSMENLTIISTSHVAKESVKKVRETIEEQKPEIVAVELDIKRLGALFSPQKRIPLSMVKRVGVRGFIFLVFARSAQQRIGKWVGVTPGAEMKAAVLAAKKEKAKIALIDRDIEVTIRRLSKALTWREKWRFFKDLVSGLAGRGPKIEGFDVRKVPPSRVIEAAMKYLRKSYPGIYRVLVEERNMVMARNLLKIMEVEKGKRIVVVVGAGHEEGIKELLNSEEFKNQGNQ